MLVTELGIVTDFKPRQPSKASFPMLVTELGIVTDSKREQPKKTILFCFDELVVEIKVILDAFCQLPCC